MSCTREINSYYSCHLIPQHMFILVVAITMADDLLEEFTSKLVISSDSEEGGVIS